LEGWCPSTEPRGTYWNGRIYFVGGWSLALRSTYHRKMVLGKAGADDGGVVTLRFSQERCLVL